MITESPDYTRDWRLPLLTAFAGLIAAFITMCLQYPYGNFAASHGRWLDFSQLLLPGVVFGIAVSCCFAVRGYLRDAWRALGVVLSFAVSYCLSFWAAWTFELNSPYLSDQERGYGSGQAMFVGGLAGGFCIVSAISLLLNSRTACKQHALKAICGAIVGALLGLAGRSVASSINPPLWQMVHSLNLTPPGITLRNVKGQYEFSLWAVWQTGMGFVLGLIVNRKSNTALG
jgi:hypothetical protein